MAEPVPVSVKMTPDQRKWLKEQIEVKMKVQAMTPEHKLKRVTFARWLLDNYGRLVDGRTVWGRLVNTDFSGKNLLKFVLCLFQIIFFQVPLASKDAATARRTLFGLRVRNLLESCWTMPVRSLTRMS